MIGIFNRQKKIDIDPSDFEEFTDLILKVSPETAVCSVSVAFVSDRQIRKLNKQFRKKDHVTDVLSFPDEPDEFDAGGNYLGDIVISVEQASRQALENDLPLELEIKQLILHGILHLRGFDHETDNGEMDALELKLRDKLGIA